SGFGPNNYACAFNGVIGAVDCTTNQLLAPTGQGSGTNYPFSVAFWFKANPTDTRFQAMMGRSDTSWRFGFTGTGTQSPAWVPGLAPSTDVSGTINMNDGNWHFVVGTLNTTNARILYLDGVSNAVVNPGTVANTNLPTALNLLTNTLIGGVYD